MTEPLTSPRPVPGVSPAAVTRAVPTPPPITPDDVTTWLQLTAGTDADLLGPIVDATLAYVATLPVVSTLPVDQPWTGDVVLGTTMLAARLYRRRLSPGGIDAVTDAGAVYVARADPDVARLLRLDNQAYPQVG